MTDSAQWTFKPDGIGHVLNERRLEVPIYQRSYSWGPQQLDDFWTDLSGAMATQQSQYFLGNIVLSIQTSLLTAASGALGSTISANLSGSASDKSSGTVRAIPGPSFRRSASPPRLGAPPRVR
jgi:hypothetical protein